MATRKPGGEPGGSEFSHGKGLMPPLERGYEPQGYEILHSQYRVDNLDPGAAESFDGTGDRDDIDVTIPVRERGPHK